VQGETPAGSSTAVVLERRASDHGSQFVDWTGRNGSGFGKASSSTARLAAGLVKVHTHTALPVLVEVVVGELLVVLDRHCCGEKWTISTS
jgi:hypothetical protein